MASVSSDAHHGPRDAPQTLWTRLSGRSLRPNGAGFPSRTFGACFSLLENTMRAHVTNEERRLTISLKALR